MKSIVTLIFTFLLATTVLGQTLPPPSGPPPGPPPGGPLPGPPLIGPPSAPPSNPFRVQGTLAIEDVSDLSAYFERIEIEILRENGNPLVPAARVDQVGLDGTWRINVPVYSSTVPGGAQPGESLILRVMYDGEEKRFISPTSGSLQRGGSGATLRLDLLMRYPYNPLDWWGELVFLDDHWKQSPWFGQFNDENFPLIFHSEHGYLRVSSGSDIAAGGINYYDFAARTWVWTQPGLYPYLHKYGPNAGWLFYYAGGQPGERWFHSLHSGIDLMDQELNSPASLRNIEFVRIPSGSFTMGSPESEPGRERDEGPQLEVTLTRDFYMQTTEVTNQQFADVMNWAAQNKGVIIRSSGILYQSVWLATIDFWNFSTSSKSPISFDGTSLVVEPGKENYPVVAVSWYGAAVFCFFLNELHGLENPFSLSGSSVVLQEKTGYRLPTEAEWEYAARAGTTTAFSSGPISHPEGSTPDPVLDLVGWYALNSENADNAIADGLGSHPVGQKQANPWGLHDMHGNVWEWVLDGYNAPFAFESLTDPFFGISVNRVLKGGSWANSAQHCRSASREIFGATSRSLLAGFRIVLTTSP